jgi:hypothetical protein
VSLALEIVPILEVEVSLHGIAKRALHPEPVWEAAFEAQEARQGYPFRGRQLVRTGRLRDSLTQPGADGAIREVHADYALFGTDVPYARSAAHKKNTPVLMHPVGELAELMLTFVVHGGEL